MVGFDSWVKVEYTRWKEGGGREEEVFQTEGTDLGRIENIKY